MFALLLLRLLLRAAFLLLAFCSPLARVVADNSGTEAFALVQDKFRAVYRVSPRVAFTELDICSHTRTVRGVGTLLDCCELCSTQTLKLSQHVCVAAHFYAQQEGCRLCLHQASIDEALVVASQLTAVTGEDSQSTSVSCLLQAQPRQDASPAVVVQSTTPVPWTMAAALQGEEGKAAFVAGDTSTKKRLKGKKSEAVDGAERKLSVAVPTDAATVSHQSSTSAPVPHIYTTRANDTPERIATKFRISLRDILQFNAAGFPHLRRRSKFLEGSRVILTAEASPVAASVAPAASHPATPVASVTDLPAEVEDAGSVAQRRHAFERSRSSTHMQVEKPNLATSGMGQSAIEGAVQLDESTNNHQSPAQAHMSTRHGGEASTARQPTAAVLKPPPPAAVRVSQSVTRMSVPTPTPSRHNPTQNTADTSSESADHQCIMYTGLNAIHNREPHAEPWPTTLTAAECQQLAQSQNWDAPGHDHDGVISYVWAWHGTSHGTPWKHRCVIWDQGYAARFGRGTVSDWVREDDVVSGQCFIRSVSSRFTTDSEESNGSKPDRSSLSKNSSSTGDVAHRLQHQLRKDRFQRDAQRFRDLQWWLMRHGAEFPGLEIRMLDDERGAGVVATRDLAAGDVIAVIPVNTMITSAHIALELKRRLNITFMGYHEKDLRLHELQNHAGNRTAVSTAQNATSSSPSRAVPTLSRGALYQHWREYTALGLALSRLDGPRGAFHDPYLRALPQDLQHLPQNWSPRARKLLDGTYLQHIVKRKEQQYRDSWHRITRRHGDAVHERLTDEDFAWALSIIDSRSFQLSAPSRRWYDLEYNPSFYQTPALRRLVGRHGSRRDSETWGPELANITTGGSRRGMSDVTESALVPLADMLNHNSRPNTMWAFDPRVGPYNYNSNVSVSHRDNRIVDDADAVSRGLGGLPQFPEGRGAFLLLASKTIRAGEIVTDSYGTKSNSQFLHQYGFVLASSPVEAQLTVTTEVVQRALLRLQKNVPAVPSLVGQKPSRPSRRANSKHNDRFTAVSDAGNSTSNFTAGCARINLGFGFNATGLRLAVRFNLRVNSEKDLDYLANAATCQRQCLLLHGGRRCVVWTLHYEPSDGVFGFCDLYVAQGNASGTTSARGVPAAHTAGLNPPRAWPVSGSEFDEIQESVSEMPACRDATGPVCECGDPGAGLCLACDGCSTCNNCETCSVCREEASGSTPPFVDRPVPNSADTVVRLYNYFDWNLFAPGLTLSKHDLSSFPPAVVSGLPHCLWIAGGSRSDVAGQSDPPCDAAAASCAAESQSPGHSIAITKRHLCREASNCDYSKQGGRASPNAPWQLNFTLHALLDSPLLNRPKQKGTPVRRTRSASGTDSANPSSVHWWTTVQEVEEEGYSFRDNAQPMEQPISAQKFQCSDCLNKGTSGAIANSAADGINNKTSQPRTIWVPRVRVSRMGHSPAGLVPTLISLAPPNFIRQHPLFAGTLQSGTGWSTPGVRSSLVEDVWALLVLDETTMEVFRGLKGSVADDYHILETLRKKSKLEREVWRLHVLVASETNATHETAATVQLSKGNGSIFNHSEQAECLGDSLCATQRIKLLESELQTLEADLMFYNVSRIDPHVVANAIKQRLAEKIVLKYVQDLAKEGLLFLEPLLRNAAARLQRFGVNCTQRAGEDDGVRDEHCEGNLASLRKVSYSFNQTAVPASIDATEQMLEVHPPMPGSGRAQRAQKRDSFKLRALPRWVPLLQLGRPLQTAVHSADKRWANVAVISTHGVDIASDRHEPVAASQRQHQSRQRQDVGWEEYFHTRSSDEHDSGRSPRGLEPLN
eukprot:INCI17279.2.p1 GENE.INCI17279.2~~INCI17279.2.p1  ORF type:complete len:1806 (+),score=215.39 INCI17279.2:142-5559(+)